MLRRTLTVLVMAAIGLPAIILGGFFYYLVITVLLVGAAWEFARLYRAVEYEPHSLFTDLSVLVIATARFFFEEWAVPLFVLSVLAAMTIHLFDFERGRDKDEADFSINVAGIFANT